MRYYREDYTDLEWYELLLSFEEELPKDYNDIFDSHGEIHDDYWELFNMDVYMVLI